MQRPLISDKRIVAIVTLLMGLGVVVFGLSELRAGWASRSWPTTPGTLATYAAKDGGRCVRFSYSVAGQAHTGTRIAFHQQSSEENPSCTPSALDRYPEGKAVAVYYDPRDPADAFLEPGPSSSAYASLGFGALFALVGAGLAWQLLSSGFRVRRATRAFAGTLDIGEGADRIPLAGTVAPSEVVVIHGSEFADETLGGNILLLDGKTSVSCQQLVVIALKAAVLEHEAAGAICLEVAEDAAGTPVLWSAPAAARLACPVPSTEARLEFRQREELAAVVHRWLASDSHAGWVRAAEKLLVPLVLRGAVTVSQKGLDRRYALGDDTVAVAAKQALPAVAATLQRCESERPRVWQLMSAAIEKAVESREPRSESPDPDDAPQPEASKVVGLVFAGLRRGNANHQQIEPAQAFDPWCDEAPSDVKRIPGLTLRVDGGLWWLAVPAFCAVFWILLIVLGVVVTPERRIALGGCAVVAVLLCLAGARWLKPEPAPAPVPRSYRAKVPEIPAPIMWVAPLAPLVALFLYVIYLNATDGWLIAAVAAALVMGGTWLLRRRAGRAISTHVSTPRPPTEARGSSAPASARAHPPVNSSDEMAAEPAPFDLEIVKPPDLPEISEHSRSRLSAIRERGPRVRGLYRRATCLLAMGCTAIAVIAWRLLDEAPTSQSFPTLRAILCAGTLLALSGARMQNSALPLLLAFVRYAFRYMKGGAAEERNRWEVGVEPIRPILAPLLGVFWVIVTGFQAIAHYPGEGPWHGALALADAAAIVTYFVYLRVERKRLETAYPVYPALSLLVLRVFGSPNADLFVDLLDYWHWFGPLYRLDGPDTAGGKSSDVVAYLQGHVDRSVIGDTGELDRAMKAFGWARDAQLRFPFNSMQCNDATWKDALQRLMDTTDFVVMDLSGLREENRGSAYEIGKLVNEVPFARFMLLVDDGTDFAFLRKLLAEVARGHSGSSLDPSTKLRLFHLGTQPARGADESVYEWQRRTSTPIDHERLIGVLCDAASAAKPATAPSVVQWTRPGYRRAAAA